MVGELGIYMEPILEHWGADSSFRLPMSIKITLKNSGVVIANYSETHWWITAFNPVYVNLKESDIRASFTVNFTSRKIYTGH